MKTLGFLIFCLYAVGATCAQQPLSRDEALRRLYHEYDAGSQTAKWVCTGAQSPSKPIDGWPCSKENEMVSISMLLSAVVTEDGVAKNYVVASAAPDKSPGGFDCHMCSPAVGMAVFAWQVDRWTLRSKNAACGFYGANGDPPDVSLTPIGPEKRGVLLSNSDVAQGYAASVTRLLVPLDNTVVVAWKLVDEQDDLGAYDPSDKSNSVVPYRSWAAFKFVGRYGIEDEDLDYYDIEVISTGEDDRGPGGRLKQENWKEIYRFSAGKYALLRHTDFVETQKAAKAK